jgi:Pyruvate/2-oxoacid:ferredoxin oxidoreductase gamma subunit
MVMLGALLKALPLLPEGAIERALAAHTAERHKRLMTLNVEALKKGMSYA